MALIQPAALALLAAAAIPLVLHLLVRRRGREVPFPTLRFLSPSLARRLSLGRLRDVALLSVRVSAIVILALVLAGLYRLGGAAFLQATGRLNRVVVVDLSGSMQAGGALGAARGAAGSALEVSPGDRVGIVAYHGEAWTVTALTTDLEEAREGLESLWEAEGPAGSSHGSALLQALRLLHGVPGRREVVWVSDYRAAGFAGLERRAAQAGVAWVSRPVAEATLANDAPAAVRVDRDGGAIVLRVWVDRFDEDGSWERHLKQLQACLVLKITRDSRSLPRPVPAPHGHFVDVELVIAGLDGTHNPRGEPTPTVGTRQRPSVGGNFSHCFRP